MGALAVAFAAAFHYPVAMFSLDELKRLVDDADRLHRAQAAAPWRAWLSDHCDRLLEAMGAWLDALLADPPSACVSTTRQVLSLWAAPGIVERPELGRVAACYAAACPAAVGGDASVLDTLCAALDRVMAGQPAGPDLPVQHLLGVAARRPDLTPSAQQVFARFAFPHLAGAWRDQLASATVDARAAVAHQAWLLRFTGHPEFQPTWGVLFASADDTARGALLDAVRGTAGEGPVQAALASQGSIDGPRLRSLDPARAQVG